MELKKKIIIFDGKMFYNARHLYNFLVKYYSFVHPVTYYQVEDATGKRLRSIDKFYKVTYDYVSKEMKDKIKRYMQISEGYEEIIAFDSKTIDDFLIKYLGVRDVGYLFLYRNIKKEITLAFKPFALKKIIDKFDHNLADIYLERIQSESELVKDYYHYLVKPTSIRQNIF